MNYYKLVQLSDKVNRNIHFMIDSLRNGITEEDSVEWTVKKLRETQIQAELLKDKLLQLNVNNVIIAANEVKE